MLQLAEMVETLSIDSDSELYEGRFPIVVVKEVLSRKCRQFELNVTSSFISLTDCEELLQVRNMIRLLLINKTPIHGFHIFHFSASTTGKRKSDLEQLLIWKYSKFEVENIK